jgi:hypothetical protein
MQAQARLDEKLGWPEERPAETLGMVLHPTAPAEARAVLEQTKDRLWHTWAHRMQPPALNINFKDRHHKALYALALTSAVTGFMAGDAWKERLGDAFRWAADPVVVQNDHTQTEPAHDQAPTPVAMSVEAWITPPEGVPRAPAYLSFHGGRQEDNKSNPMAAHKNSTMVIHVRHSNAPVMHNGQAITADENTSDKAGIMQYRLTLTEGTHRITIGDDGPRWEIISSPDMAPDIVIDRITQPDKQNNLMIDYSIRDDSGPIKDGQVKIKPADDHVEGRIPLPARRFQPERITPTAPAVR